MVVEEPQQMERSISPDSDTHPHHVRRRQQSRMGWCIPQPVSTRSLVHRRGRRIHQLAGIKSHRPDSSHILRTHKHHHSNTHRQHYGKGLRKQTRRHTISQAKSTSNNDLGKVSPSGTSHPSATHTGRAEQSSRLRVTAFLPEEPLADDSHYLREDSASMGSSRRGSVCRQNVSSTPSICFLEGRSSSNGDGCHDDSMESVPESIYESAVEPDPVLPPEDNDRTVASSDHSDSILANGDLVSHASTNGDFSTHSAEPGEAHAHHSSFRDISMEKRELEALRLESIRNRFQSLGYSDHMIETLSKAIKEQTGPKTPYRRAQYLFLQWSIRNKVDVNKFSTTDLTNFLGEALQNGYSISTIQVFKTAVCLFHLDQDKIKNSPDLRTLFRHSRKTAPPRSLSKPAIDISPSLRFIAQIPSSPTTALSDLNKKTAFLLAMAAFLRPSDLERISLQDCQVNRQGDLTISIKAPKERRAGRLIIKTLLIKHNSDYKELCPVLAFVALRDHPAASATVRHKLLVNSKNPKKILRTTTISTWLRGIVRLSTPQKPVPSVRSLASDLALARGVPLADVVTMGNWSSHSVFDNHYRRQRLLRQNITNFVLRL